MPQRLVTYIASNSRETLAALATMAEEVKLTPVISRSFAFDEVADAFRYLETGHASAKIGIRVRPDAGAGAMS